MRRSCGCRIDEAGAHGSTAKQADIAMDWLKRAVTAGYKNVEHMRKDKDLDALREREDFKKLIADLEEKSRAPSAKS